jgi:hypothetical protein
MKVGDLVRIKTEYDHSHTQRVYRFRLATRDIRYVESRDLEGKKGIIISEGTDLGVYHVAFGSIVIRVYQDYFEKVEKTLNKTNN